MESILHERSFLGRALHNNYWLDLSTSVPPFASCNHTKPLAFCLFVWIQNQIVLPFIEITNQNALQPDSL